MEQNENTPIILTGEEARKVLHEILDSEVDEGAQYIYPAHEGAVGYYRETVKDGSTVYVSFDNSTGECWTEDFHTEASAEGWCEGRLDAEEAHELECNVETILLSRDSFKPLASETIGGMPSCLEFNENDELPVKMSFYDGYAVDNNPHGLGYYDRVGLYYPTVKEVMADPNKQADIESYTGRAIKGGSDVEKYYEIALRYGQASRLHCPDARYDQAKDAVIQRVTDPAAKAFSPEQRDLLLLAADSSYDRNPAFRDAFFKVLVTNAVAQMDRDKVSYDKDWLWDVRQELGDLAKGILRDQQQSLRL